MNENKLLRHKWFYALEYIIDVLIVTFAYFAGLYFQRKDLFINGIPSEVIITLAYIALVSFIIFGVFKIYQCGKIPYIQIIFDLLTALVIILITIVIIDFVIKGIGIWRRTIFNATLIQLPIFLIYKFIAYKIYLIIYTPPKSIIIDATLEDAATLSLKVIRNENTQYCITKLIVQDSNDLVKEIRKHKKVLISSGCEPSIITTITEYCAFNNIDCTIIPTLKDIIINSGAFNNIGDLLAFDMNTKMDIETRILKRLMDIILSVIGIIITLPFMIVSALIIFLQDRGSPIFTQERLTRKNEVFEMYKLRTMIKDAEKNTGAVLADANDNRVTKFGKFLRAFRIDEFPQLFNVLKGDMSIVGPRPERREIANTIIEEVPEFQYRTTVKAGLTGLAQTYGKYDTKFKEKAMLDLYYASHYSLILDFKIVFYTIRTILQPNNAKGISANGGISSIERLMLLKALNIHDKFIEIKDK